MKRAGQVSGTARLVGQPKKILNFISKRISDHMEPSQPTFTNPSQSGKGADSLPYNCNPGGPAHQIRENIVLGLHKCGNLAEKK